MLTEGCIGGGEVEAVNRGLYWGWGEDVNRGMYWGRLRMLTKGCIRTAPGSRSQESVWLGTCEG